MCRKETSNCLASTCSIAVKLILLGLSTASIIVGATYSGKHHEYLVIADRRWNLNIYPKFLLALGVILLFFGALQFIYQCYELLVELRCISDCCEANDCCDKDRMHKICKFVNFCFALLKFVALLILAIFTSNFGSKVCKLCRYVCMYVHVRNTMYIRMLQMQHVTLSTLF